MTIPKGEIKRGAETMAKKYNLRDGYQGRWMVFPGNVRYDNSEEHAAKKLILFGRPYTDDGPTPGYFFYIIWESSQQEDKAARLVVVSKDGVSLSTDAILTLSSEERRTYTEGLITVLERCDSEVAQLLENETDYFRAFETVDSFLEVINSEPR